MGATFVFAWSAAILLQVGKKLKKAENETDTTIRSRAIHMPLQSLTEEKEGLAVSTRNLTLKELLSQSSHYR